MDDYAIEMIRAYVPEAEHLTFEEALAIATQRDEEAAEQFVLSVLNGMD